MINIIPKHITINQGLIQENHNERERLNLLKVAQAKANGAALDATHQVLEQQVKVENLHPNTSLIA